MQKLLSGGNVPNQHCLDASINPRGGAAVRNPILQMGKLRPGDTQGLRGNGVKPIAEWGSGTNTVITEGQGHP